MPPASITKSSVLKLIAKIDIGDVTSLRAFVSHLQYYCSEAKIPSRTAQSLTLAESFKYFGFTNETQQNYGGELIIIPENFRINVMDSVESSKLFDWLKTSLNYIGESWNNRTEAARRIFIEILATAAIQQARLSAPTAPLPLRGFCKLPLSFQVTDPDTDTPVIISGCCDVGIGYSSAALPSIETFLAVVEAKSGTTLESAFPQLLAYMGIVQAARQAERKRNSTVYGIFSDSYAYTFVRLDNHKTVSKSRPLSIVNQLPEVFAFMVHLLRSAIESSPSISPTKLEAAMRRDVDRFAMTVEPKYFSWDILEESSELGDDVDEHGWRLYRPRA